MKKIYNIQHTKKFFEEEKKHFFLHINLYYFIKSVLLRYR